MQQKSVRTIKKSYTGEMLRQTKKSIRITEVIKILLDNAPAFNSEEEKQTYIMESIKKLIDSGVMIADVRTMQEDVPAGDYRQELYSAIASGDSERLEFLIEDGVDIDQVVDANGSTPLHISAIKGQMECMRILFSAGANHYIRNNHGNTTVEVFRSMYPEKHSENV